MARVRRRYRSTYASEDYQEMLRDHGIACSMSRRGNCHDNAAMESWFSTVKFELGETFESIRSAKDQLFDYIEVFYNQYRRHSSIAYRSPAQQEQHYRAPIELMWFLTHPLPPKRTERG